MKFKFLKSEFKFLKGTHYIYKRKALNENAAEVGQLWSYLGLYYQQQREWISYYEL